MRLRKLTHPVLKLFLLLLCGGALLLWTALDLGCPFRHLTGVPCPGCGMSRAWLAVLAGNLGATFRYHPMFWAVPVAALYALWEGTPFRSARINRALGFGLLAGLALCWIIRLAAFFRGLGFL